MAEEQTSKRKRTLTRLFEHESEPKVRPRADLDVTAVIFNYEDGKNTRFELADIFPGGLPKPCVARAAAAFGVNTSAGNAGNTLDSDAPDDIRDAVEGRLELFSAGKWSQERQGGGPRTSILLEALVAYRKGHNMPIDEASLQKFRDRFDDKDAVKSWMADPDFAKVYYQIQAEKRIANAESKGKAAADLLA